MEASDLLLAVIVATATAVGAGVGGVITARATRTIEEARARRDDDRERRRRQTSRRFAARILAEELSWHGVYIRSGIDGDESPPKLPDPTSLRDAWLNHREHLADLDWHEYGMVQLAVLAILRLNELNDWEDVPGTLSATLKPLERAQAVVDKLAK